MVITDMLETAGRVLTHVVVTMGGILLEVTWWLLAIAAVCGLIYVVAVAITLVFMKALSLWIDFVIAVLHALGVRDKE
jgi:hypothetical protein